MTHTSSKIRTVRIKCAVFVALLVVAHMLFFMKGVDSYAAAFQEIVLNH